MIRAWKQAAAAMLCLIASTFAIADEVPDATVEFSAASVAVIAGVRWGTGTLHYQGQSYPFHFRGVSVADLGIKGIWGTGEVYHLWRLEDFAGNYDAVSLGLTIAGGGQRPRWRTRMG